MQASSSIAGSRFPRRMIPWAAALTGMIFVLWLGYLFFSESIRFAIDRRMVRNTLRELGHDSFSIPLPPVIIEPLKQLPSTAPNTPLVRCDIGGLEVAFAGETLAVDGVNKRYFKNDNMGVLFQTSSAERVCIPGADVGSMVGSVGGRYILQYLNSTQPFEVLKSVYTARLEDIDSPSDVGSRYRALYLYAYKGVMIFRAAYARVREYRRGSVQMLAGGELDQGHAFVDIYFGEQRKFISFSISSKRGACTWEEIEKLLGSISLVGSRSK